MWNEFAPHELEAIPKLYATEQEFLADKVVHAHLFLAGCDWYIIECDGRDICWGFAILNGDIQNAEFGYFSLEELKKIRIGPFEIDRDLYWKPTKVAYVDKIQECLWHRMPARKPSTQENCEDS